MNALFWVMGRVDGRLVLNIEEVAETIGLEVQTVYNQQSSGTFPIPMRKQGKRWFADARDVAEYLDEQRTQARQAHDAIRKRMGNA
jgi:predicted DNA-binding transcriptional regulator AlpA